MSRRDTARWVLACLTTGVVGFLLGGYISLWLRDWRLAALITVFSLAVGTVVWAFAEADL